MTDIGETSDGFHTFNELYEHRYALYMAFCMLLSKKAAASHVWKSKKHHDGSMYDGWFVMGCCHLYLPPIAYHLPLKYWDECWFAEEIAVGKEWDGHTPEDVVNRLHQFIKQ